MSAWIVFRKECTDAFRDWRSLGASIATMLAGPVLVAFVLGAVLRGVDESGPLPVEMVGGDRAPSLLKYLRENEVVEPEAVKNRSIRLVIGEDYADLFQAARPAPVRIEYDSSIRSSGTDARRLADLIRGYHTRIAALRLMARGVQPSVAAPLAIELHDRAGVARASVAALATIPIFLAVGVFFGGMNLAIDATAGERERRSLEQLLLHPVSHTALAVGKWLAAFAAASISAAGTVFCVRILFDLPFMQSLPVRLEMDSFQALQILLLLVPLAALASALQLLLALTARNFKEAQTYLSLLLLAPTVPGFLIAFGSLRGSPAMGLVPLLGHLYRIGEILQGKSAAWTGDLALSAATAGAVVLLLNLLVRAFAREELLRNA